MHEVRMIRCSPAGQPVGEDAHQSRFSDAAVAEARALRAQGLFYREIAKRIGCTTPAVWYWLTGRKRRPHVKVVARLRKVPSEPEAKPGSSDMNHEPKP
jgi:hypothetical protein